LKHNILKCKPLSDCHKDIPGLARSTTEKLLFPEFGREISIARIGFTIKTFGAIDPLVYTVNYGFRLSRKAEQQSHQKSQTYQCYLPHSETSF
jgi:hypothetical protein